MNTDLIEVIFTNQSDKEIVIFSEPAAYSIEIPPLYEYKLVTDDKQIKIEFTNDDMTFWLENRFGYKLMKRKLSSKVWELEIDTIDIGR